MPQAAAAAFTGYASLGAAAAAGVGAAFAYVCPAMLEESPPVFSLKATELPMETICTDLIAAHEHGHLSVEIDPAFVLGARLIGPSIASGRCLASRGITSGAVLFFDPALPMHGGDTVLVRNRCSLAEPGRIGGPTLPWREGA